MLRNIYKAKRKSVREIHSGIGEIKFSRIFSFTDFKTNIDFIDYAIIPPGSSIGFHQHLENEEFYLVLKGKGKMRVGSEKFYVEQGDLVVNPDNSSHGLENCSDKEIHIFVVQVANKNYLNKN